jgi:hypothetical protein
MPLFCGLPGLGLFVRPAFTRRMCCLKKIIDWERSDASGSSNALLSNLASDFACGGGTSVRFFRLYRFSAPPAGVALLTAAALLWLPVLRSPRRGRKASGY